MERTIRAVFSARSTYRPSQKTLSATLLGTALGERRSSTGSFTDWTMNGSQITASQVLTYQGSTVLLP